LVYGVLFVACGLLFASVVVTVCGVLSVDVWCVRVLVRALLFIVYVGLLCGVWSVLVGVYCLLVYGV